MQIYAMRLVNFMRYGEKNNSVIFDLSQDEKDKISKGESSLDLLYDEFVKNPVSKISEIKARGVVGFVGIVSSDPSNSNGAGKSSILEGIPYAFFEKIARKIVNSDKVENAKMSEITTHIDGKLPEGIQETSVEMFFEEDGMIYRLKRGRTFTKSMKHSPLLEFECLNDCNNDASRSGHRSGNTSEYLQKVIKMDFDTALSSILFAQLDSGKFLSGTNKTRKDMLINVFGLENIISACLESLRAKKNAKDKELSEVSALLSLSKDFIKGSGSIEAFEASILTNNQNIESIVNDISSLEANIEALNRSDEIKVLEQHRNESKRLNSELGDKKKQMDAQMEEWKNLYNDAQNSKKEKSSQIDKSSLKIVEMNGKVDVLNKKIASFNLEEQKKKLEIVAKAKDAKPRREAELQALRDEKTTLSSELGGLNSNISLANKELTLLNSQLANNSGKSDFVCDKCKSTVSKSHIEECIAIQMKLKETHEKSLADIAVLIETNKVKTAEIVKKVDTIQQYINGESNILSEIKSNGESVVRLEEIKVDISDAITMKGALENEVKALDTKMAEYKSKGTEIRAKYDDDLKAMNESLKTIAAQIAELETNAKATQSKITEAKRAKDEAVSKKAKLHTENGSFENMIKRLKEENEKVERLTSDLEAKKKIYNRLCVLEVTFASDIQIKIIKRYLPLLNCYLNEYLNELSNGSMRMSVFINDSSEIDIRIEGGSSDLFYMLSGGEKAIVRLSMNIAISLLSLARNNIGNAGFIALDEIFGSMDSSHIEFVFNVLHKLRDKFQRIIIITHHDWINEKLTNKVVIEKALGNSGMSEIKKVV